MSRSILFDDDEPESTVEFCTNSGWGGVCDWGETLTGKLDDGPGLLHLIEYGHGKRSLVVKHLKAALKRSPPKDADVLSTAQTLLELLESRPESIGIMVTAGIIVSDDEDEEDDE